MIGIFVNVGIGGGIINVVIGKIVIDESYVVIDVDKDGDFDGLFVVGIGCIGICMVGVYVGVIVNSGVIIVKGNNFVGIWLGGLLIGVFMYDG